MYCRSLFWLKMTMVLNYFPQSYVQYTHILKYTFNAMIRKKVLPAGWQLILVTCSYNDEIIGLVLLHCKKTFLYFIKMTTHFATSKNKQTKACSPKAVHTDWHAHQRLKCVTVLPMNVISLFFLFLHLYPQNILWKQVLHWTNVSQIRKCELSAFLAIHI